MAAAQVDLATPDGMLPVRVFFPPGPDRKGGVIVYMDAFGLRPELETMCERYAAAGYLVFLPDLYYRRATRHFPVPAEADDPLDPAMHVANIGTTVEMTIADTGVLLAHVATRGEYGISRFGVVGYCMGARHALGAGAAYGETIGATACLHGGRLVWEGDNSPHRSIPRVKGAVYFGFASNDETCPDAHQDLIERMIATSRIRGRAERFPAAHGWTFPTRWCYDPIAAERAFAAVLGLFDAEVAR